MPGQCATPPVGVTVLGFVRGEDHPHLEFPL